MSILNFLLGVWPYLESLQNNLADQTKIDTSYRPTAAQHYVLLAEMFSLFLFCVVIEYSSTSVVCSRRLKRIILTVQHITCKRWCMLRHFCLSAMRLCTVS